MSSFPPLSVDAPNPLSMHLISSCGIRPISFVAPTYFPYVSMPNPSSTLTVVTNPSQPIELGFFSPRFSQPMILVPQLDVITYRNVWRVGHQLLLAILWECRFKYVTILV